MRALGYVKATKHLRLRLGESMEQLWGFTDASWADDKVDRRSSQGYVFFLGKGAISWKATKSPAVALSSCEAELEHLQLKNCCGSRDFLQNLVTNKTSQHYGATIRVPLQ